MHSQQLVETGGPLALDESLDFVGQTNARLARAFDRLHKLHGNDLGKVYDSLVAQEEASESRSKYLFCSPSKAAHR